MAEQDQKMKNYSLKHPFGSELPSRVPCIKFPTWENIKEAVTYSLKKEEQMLTCQKPNRKGHI